VTDCHGTRTSADKSSTVLEVDDRRRAERGSGLGGAQRRPLRDERHHTNCKPISAPAAEPTMT
jgi:hypothetical protein